jgi:uncharacterized protein YhaN
MFGQKNTDNHVEKAEFAVDTVSPSESQLKAETANSADTPKKPEPAAKPAAVEASTAATDTELARLRDILFGGQARSTEKRMGDLEMRIEAIHQELSEQINSKVGNLDQTAGNQLAATRTDFVERLNMQTETQSNNLRTAQQTLNERLEQQNSDLSAQIRTTQRELSDRLEAQQTEQASELREVQKDLTQRLDTLTADFMSQLRQIQKDLSHRLDTLNETQAEQARALQAESKQRDDELRQELMTFASLLESKKVSRTDLGQMLAELGQRMRSDAI